MKRIWLTGIVAIGLVLPALAQRPPANAGADRPRPPGGRGPMGIGGAMSPADIVRQLPQQLDLTAEQRQQYDAIADKYRPRWEELEGRTAEMRELAMQYREARRSGDTARADEIAARMRELGGGRGRLLREFLADVETILDEQQVEKLKEFQQRMRDRGREGTGRDAGMRQLIERLPDELGLDDEQRAAFDALVADLRTSRRQQREELRPLVEELREARRAGDEQRAAELMAQLRERRAGASDSRALLDKLVPILTEEQKAKLKELEARFTRGRGPVDVRQILEVAKRLDLNEQQRERLKEIMREATAVREQGRLDAEARAELAQAVKQQIVEMLDADQAKEFERMLQRGPRRGPANGPGGGHEIRGGNQDDEGHRNHGERRRDRGGNTP